MNLKNILFRLRYWLRPITSKEIEKKIFASWLKTLPDSHEFSMSFDQDPISQFLRCTTRVMHVTVGLDWYSFEKPLVAKTAPVRNLSNGELCYCYADLWEKPLTECHGLPAWASSVMWDKKIGAEFTKSVLLKHHPKLLSL